MGSKVVTPMSGIERLAADGRPALDATQVAGLPVRVFRFKREVGLDHEVHHGFILKANVNAVILTGGKEFNVVQWFALGFFKAVEVPAVITADGGLAAPGDDGFGRSGKSWWFSGFARGLRAVDRAFTLNGSHGRLLYR
jgi:hypothetical protein